MIPVCLAATAEAGSISDAMKQMAGRTDAVAISASFQRTFPTTESKRADDEAYSFSELKEGRDRVTSLLAQFTSGQQTHQTLCSRAPCIHGTYQCPAKIGNGMHEFMSAFILALVSDVSLVWTWKQYGGGLLSCEHFLHRAAWLAPLEHAHLRVSAVCPFATEELETHLACHGAELPACKPPQRGRPFTIEVRTRGPARYSAQEVASLGLLSRSHRGVNGSSRTDNSLGRASHLFALGPHYAYGKAFSSAFSFDWLSVRKPTLDVLQRAGLVVESRGQMPYYYERQRSAGKRGSLWIGVHMRHRDDRLNGTEEVPAYVDAVAQTLERRNWPRCVVLLASDRRVSLPAFEARLRERRVSCVLVSSERAAQETDRSKQSAQTGADTGVVALRDVFLLSHSSVLIAGFGGTFAALIGELMAHRFVENHAIALGHSATDTAAKPRAPAIRFCDQPAFSGKCAPELSLVSPSWWHLSLTGWPNASLVTTAASCTTASVQASSNVVSERTLDSKARPLPKSTSARSKGERTSSASPLAGLVLRSAAEHPAWDNYLTAVYGAVEWPVHLDRLTWLYWSAPVELNVTCGISFEHNVEWRQTAPHLAADGRSWLNVPAGKAWLPKFGRYKDTNPYHPLSDYGVFVAPPEGGKRHLHGRMSEASWTEVIRADKPNGTAAESSRTGTWFYGVRGSGIWLELGGRGRHLDLTCVRTDAVKSETQPHSFGPWDNTSTCLDAVRLLTQRARAELSVADSHLGLALAGKYETMVRHYWRDGRLEVVDFRERSSDRCSAPPCPKSRTCGAGATARHLRVGTVGTLRPCHCVDSLDFLNCGANDHPLVWTLAQAQREAERWPPRALIRKHCPKGTGWFRWRPTAELLEQNARIAGLRRKRAIV